MKLKQRVGDFRVRELLVRDYLASEGDHRVYRVTKRKLTSDEAARHLADEAGVPVSEVCLAGLKDRQGITIQYMSVARGREVRIDGSDLKVETAGFARAALTSEHSTGNAFELTVRALQHADVARLRTNLPRMRDHGLLNYFDDQRFGNLTHGQGWIYRELCLGNHEKALRDLLAAPSPRDDDRHRRFKQGLARHWGDWRECRDDAGRFGAHHSVFEHLARSPEDFAGAFDHVATRVKLIHLFAWQSHLWNRAVTELVRAGLPVEQRVVLECVDGTLLAHDGLPPASMAGRASFPLPGERLDGVGEADRAAFAGALASEGLAPEQMAAPGVRGFALKAEERELFLHPAHLRVRPAEPDVLNPGRGAVRVRFELPRGSYATLVVKRLLAGPVVLGRERSDAAEVQPQRPVDERGDPRGPARYHQRGPRDEHHGRPGGRERR
jgi:tRNA pseudouridine13 synthase